MTSWISSLWARLRQRFRGGSVPTLDPEMREIFLSELEEVSDAMVALLPAWRQQRKHPPTLQEIRRGFHTLKGSGLAVGAHELGSFCGRIEKLVVDLVERPMRATPEAIASIESAIGLLPSCGRAMRSGSPMPAALRTMLRSLPSG
jgi:chemosensory pili system protein ChpA (sensor histidine kinase/response regulator)